MCFYYCRVDGMPNTVNILLLPFRIVNTFDLFDVQGQIPIKCWVSVLEAMAIEYFYLCAQGVKIL